MRAIVTGASRGIGRAIAEAIVARGGRVYAVARSPDALEELERASAGAVTPRIVDLGDARARAGLAADGARALGGLDVVVANAGMIHRRPVVALGADDVREELELNYLAPLELLLDASRIMAGAEPIAAAGSDRARAGVLVAIASNLAYRPVPGALGYAASKAALLSAVRSLALELGPYGVRANAVVPGLVETDMVRARIDADRAGANRLQALERIARPAEIAEAVLYLIDAPFVTGHELVVDGGRR